MKKFSAIGYLALLLAFSLVFFNPQAAAQEKEQSKNIISAKGAASGDFAPDTARVTIAVETESKNLTDAIDKNNEVAEKINTSVEKLLGKDDTVKTTNFQVNPVYTYDREAESKNKITGYKVINQIQVITKDITAPGRIIETALNSGANRVSGLNYEISDTKKICKGLLEKAVKDTRDEAETLARALGVEISGISRVSSSCNGSYYQPYMARELGMDALKAAPPLKAGESTVSAQVYIDFIIE